MPHMDATHSTEKEPVCTHLHKRASGYTYRRNIPKDLQTYFGRSVNFEALGTHDRKEACMQCRERGLRDDREFARVRALLKTQAAGHSPIVAANAADVPNRPLSLADVTPEIQAVAEADLEMYRVSGVLNDRTGLALQIEQLPPRGTLDQWTHHVLLRLRQKRQSMEGMGDLDRDLLMDRLRSDLDMHERVLAGELGATMRMLYHEGHRNALKLFFEGRDGDAIARYESAHHGAPRADGGVARGVGKGNPLAAASSSPLLSHVIEHFLSKQDQLAPMFSKYKPALSLFLELVGDRPVDAIRQIHVDGFFEALCRLPPRWSDEKRRLGVGVVELAAMSWPRVISPKTFEDSYRASFRPFLRYASRVFGDQGFPRLLTAEGIRYSGDGEAGEGKQRAFTSQELKRLFEGEEMRSFAIQQEQQHFYWLPLIGLYTGARVNELCQLNPQVDIREEDGIWFFEITEKSAGDARIIKRVKNKGSQRRVPIHRNLIDLGFLLYVNEIKRAGSALLFPQWSPSKGRASTNAEKWFGRFLGQIGLRDETPGLRVVGFHTFRHTFLTHARDNKILNAEWITGHVTEGVGAVVRGYQGELILPSNTGHSIKQLV